MMATVPHVTSGSGLRKFQADVFFLFDRVYSDILKKGGVFTSLRHLYVSVLKVTHISVNFKEIIKRICSSSHL